MALNHSIGGSNPSSPTTSQKNRDVPSQNHKATCPLAYPTLKRQKRLGPTRCRGQRAGQPGQRADAHRVTGRSPRMRMNKIGYSIPSPIPRFLSHVIDCRDETHHMELNALVGQLMKSNSSNHQSRSHDVRGGTIADLVGGPQCDVLANRWPTSLIRAWCCIKSEGSAGPLSARLVASCQVKFPLFISFCRPIFFFFHPLVRFFLFLLALFAVTFHKVLVLVVLYLICD